MKNIIPVADIQGLLVAAFLITCMCAGFVVFPGFVLMNLWNRFIETYQLNLIQGVLLWAIVALAYFTIKKRHLILSLIVPHELSDEEMDDLMERVKKARGLKKNEDETTSDEVNNEKNFNNHI